MNLPFAHTLALYRRNNFGQPCVWYAFPFDDYSFEVYHGILGKKLITERIRTHRKVTDEIDSRFKAKRKVGYKYLSELKDNVTLPVEGELLNYLNSYLPDYRTTTDGSLLPMLAKTFDNANNKLFNKIPTFIGQYKINGLRCFISAEANFGDLFKPIRLKFQSREGTYWNSLESLEDYLLSVIDKDFLMSMVEEHYILDGEVYLPGCTVNEINHFVKDSNCPENKLIQYWCYDIAIEDVMQYKRIEILHNKFNKHLKVFQNKYQHYDNNEKLVVLPTIDINTEEKATITRNSMIDFGFEGLILRNPEAEYQFGKRNLSMIKYKKSTDGKFTIVDIYPEGIKRSNIPLFKCKNDINDSYFECHVGGTHSYQESILKNKEKYIGKQMYVEYGERSGVEQLPFHIKTTYII